MGTIIWKFGKITSEREAEFPLCLVVKLLWGSSLLTWEEELSPIKLSLEVQTYGRKCSLTLTTMSNGFGVRGFGRLRFEEWKHGGAPFRCPVKRAFCREHADPQTPVAPIQ